MGCGCLVFLAAMASPRLALVLLQVFSHRLEIAFSSFWIGFIGFLFLPWTALAWAVCYDLGKGVTGFGWFVVILAFLADLASYGSGERERRQRYSAPAY